MALAWGLLCLGDTNASTKSLICKYYNIQLLNVINSSLAGSDKVPMV